MSSKNERAAAARAKAQAQVKAQERRTTMIIVAASVVGLALFGALIFFIVNQGKVPALGEAGSTAPAASDASGGIPVGSGGVVGEDVPEDAPRVDIYLDFMCPICGTFEQINEADLNELREAGEIQVWYHPVSILDRFSNSTQFSTRSAAAAGVVADRAPEAFLDFMTAMFVNQPSEGTDGLSDDQIEEIALAAGVPEDVAGSLSNADFRKWATAATTQASQDGMQGTPTIAVSASGDFADMEILDPNDVAYFSEGGLKAYLEGLG
ncbi:DsbA family protein [Demequina pelophila]|uniref:DsbA family protein n=1 Tax=Demequina pelophila TaxID=1638984 RepID=UPI000785961E|nr:thioredoxin domain-containing protein [Demequina pelophila]